MANEAGHAVQHWEHFAHEADMGVRGIGSTCAEAFEQAALALSAIVTDLAAICPTQKVEIACTAPDVELLLADWLNAIIFEMATRHMLFSRYEVKLADGHLAGVAWGEPVEAARHQPAVEPKGATYTSLVVRRQQDGNWLAQCIVDV
ncbi:MAG: archease [Nitrosomonadales bacterium]|nr:MAG: archease [Nitrosomonadales bacterium]